MTTKSCRKSGKKHTPIMSMKEAGAMGKAYSVKKGESSKSSMHGASKEMYEGMSREELKRHLKEWGHRRNKMSKRTK